MRNLLSESALTGNRSCAPDVQLCRIDKRLCRTHSGRLRPGVWGGGRSESCLRHGLQICHGPYHRVSSCVQEVGSLRGKLDVIQLQVEPGTHRRRELCCPCDLCLASWLSVKSTEKAGYEMMLCSLLMIECCREEIKGNIGPGDRILLRRRLVCILKKNVKPGTDAQGISMYPTCIVVTLCATVTSKRSWNRKRASPLNPLNPPTSG